MSSPVEVRTKIRLIHKSGESVPEGDLDSIANEVSRTVENTKSRSTCIATQGFIFNERLGSGTFGTVFSACQGENCRYALKIFTYLRNTLADSDVEEMESFLVESSAMAELDGLGVTPKYYGSFACTLSERKEEDIGVIVMELMSGDIQDILRSLFEEGRTTEELLSVRDSIGRQVEDKLKLVVPLRWSHMDLKSQNILYRTTPDDVDVRIADWGIGVKYDARGRPMWTNYYVGNAETKSKRFGGFKMYNPFLDLILWEYHFDMCSRGIAESTIDHFNQNDTPHSVDLDEWRPYRVDIELDFTMRDKFKNGYMKEIFRFMGECK